MLGSWFVDFSISFHLKKRRDEREGGFRRILLVRCGGSPLNGGSWMGLDMACVTGSVLPLLVVYVGPTDLRSS